MHAKKKLLNQSYPKAYLSRGASIEKSENYTPAKDSIKYHNNSRQSCFSNKPIPVATNAEQCKTKYAIVFL